MAGLLIAGFGAIGKTTLSKKYNNVVDLESSLFKYIIDNELEKIDVEERKGLKTRKINPDYPENYYAAIIENLKKYDIVLISMHNEIIKKLEENNIDYMVVYPKEEMLDEIMERCRKRGNTEDFLAGVKDVYYKLYPTKNAKVFWLNNGEYIEDILLKNKMLEKIIGGKMFKLHSEYKPTGDQPQAIEYLVNGINEGKKFQTLLGVTGSGKTFTMANIIQKVQKPTLVLAHNKTLAGQLYSEFKEFFPENAVEYFVSYYDYYQPEAYIPQSNTYIEKDASINDEIDKLRHSATASLFERKDVIIVASVSCIYGLGDPIDYEHMIISLRPGMSKTRDEVLRKLINMQYSRNEIDFKRGTFRAKGDIVEIYPSEQNESAIRVEFWGDEIEKISEINPLTGKVIAVRNHVMIFPNSHYVTTNDKMEKAILSIEEELEERIKYFKDNEKFIEAQRIEERTNFDIEMLKETGFCQGIENYSRHISGRPEGSAPFTLFDYFPKDFLLMIDESHATIPQVRAMYNGDRARKESLVNYGFRLPSAFDNRPLKFNEFEERLNQVVFVSATPAEYENEHSKENVVEQIIRPTGLLDPQIEVKPVTNQIDDLISQINERVERGERVLVTTLTKKMAEDLTSYLKSLDIKVNYMHSDIKALERMEIIRNLRLGEFDVLVGINLLREGLDIPEVSLVAILDADKEGFLRSERSLIQTIGRAARNTDGKVIMYADELTESMEKAITETNRRRKIQEEYNIKNNITPQTIKKSVRDTIKATVVENISSEYNIKKDEDIKEIINKLTDEMLKCAANMEFEKAAELRDKIKELEELV